MRHHHGRTLGVAALLLSFFTALVLPAAQAAPIIDRERTSGSLTIFKYLGSSMDQPEAGAGFSAYQLLTLQWEGDVLTCTATPGFEDYFAAGGGLPDRAEELSAKAADAQAVGEYVRQRGLTPYRTSALTDRYGQTKLGELPLGWYLVEETTTPGTSHRSSPSFLVSMPMTRVDGTGWLYDITAYPKSQPATPNPPDPSRPPVGPVDPGGNDDDDDDDPDPTPRPSERPGGGTTDDPDQPGGGTPGDPNSPGGGTPGGEPGAPVAPDVDIGDGETPLGPADPFAPEPEVPEIDIEDQRPPLGPGDLPKTGGIVPVEALLAGGPVVMVLSLVGMLLVERKRRSDEAKEMGHA